MYAVCVNMCLGVNVRKAGHGGERGVVIKQICVGMCFVNVHMCARSYGVIVLIVFLSPMSP